MTVVELIEELRGLPGDPDLRAVIFRVRVQRPYASDAWMECSVNTIQIEHDVVVVRANGYID